MVEFRAFPPIPPKDAEWMGHPVFLAQQASCFPRYENPDLHPTDEDLSVGTPDLGHPSFVLMLAR